MRKKNTYLKRIISVFRDAFKILAPQERKVLVLIGLLVFVSSISEILGIASIVPFVTILTTPSVIQSTTYLRWLYEIGHFRDTASFIIALGVGSISILTVSTVVNIFALTVSSKWIYLREHSIAMRLFKHYLHKPYDFFLNKHSTEFSKNIFTEIAIVINGIYIPGLYLITKLISALIIACILFIFNPKAALAVFFIFGGLYVFVFLVLNRKFSKWGNARVEANEERFKVVSEAFGGMEEVILYHKQNFFLGIFKSPSKAFAVFQGLERIIGQLPRYFIELVAFGGVILYIVIQLVHNADVSHLVPLIAVYVLAGYRLLPDLQQIYSHATKINFNRASLYHLAEELASAGNDEPVLTNIEMGPLEFKKEAALVNVDFSFEGNKKSVLNKMNLAIHPGQKIGLIGDTGSGKSTTINVFVGLLTPNSGFIQVDGCKITDELKGKWQEKIGFVTQHIYLSGASIRQNVAFGLADSEINIDEVIRACKIANVHDFIESELPQGYNTNAGERGIKLSGGQIQRIGIARAIYRKPEFLIMDEATSALDAATEAKVYEQIYESLPYVSAIIITHRLSALKKCDCIYLLEGGRIADQGTFGELFEKNTRFQSLISKFK